MDNTTFDNPSKQLLYIAEQLTNLAKIMDNSTEQCGGEQVSENACQAKEDNFAEESATTSVNAEMSEKKHLEENSLNAEHQVSQTDDSEKTENEQTPKAQKVESSEKDENAQNKENKQKEKVQKVEAKPIENQSTRQIGGGLNGMFGGFNMKNMPGLGNLFGGMMGGMGLPGGMGGLGGLAGLSGLSGKTPESVEEVKNNPQMMAMLGSLENNPSLLNTIAAMSGMDKEQILNAIKALRSDSPEAAAENSETAAQTPQAAANPMGNLNLNSLGDLSRLFGGQPAPSASAMSGMPNQPSATANQTPPGTMPMGSAMSVGGSMPLRGTMGGDPLTNLLNQWHWTPLRS